MIENKNGSKVKLLVIHIGNIYYYPPVLSLLYLLNKLEIATKVFTTKSNICKDVSYEFVEFKMIDYNYEKHSSPLYKLLKIYGLRSEVNNFAFESDNGDAVIWITNSVSLKHISNKLLKSRKYVLQLMELSDNLWLHPRIRIGKDKTRVGNDASAVVVPEYNRAHITKAQWNLKELPEILPNKPYYNIYFEKKCDIKNEDARHLVRMIGDRKIVLYQGILNDERPLYNLVDACEELGDQYVFVIMSRGDNPYKTLKYKNLYFIPFIEAPYHLQVTSHAYIGVMAYLPSQNEFSKLNALYCAPNKIYEYGMFGIPMIGNDIPGLRYVFETEQCGKCFDLDDKESIKLAIRKIESNYQQMSMNASKLYSNTDNYDNLLRILKKVGI